ncbi:zinc-binding dehydrogenase [Aeromicrobium sp. UC242_57]|uniref:zinc-binding dehydrogenase n=1 Tax=Aeromicrobium sp. UC242_57 TaxID=3374624 RepID=UPI0037BEA8A4
MTACVTIAVDLDASRRSRALELGADHAVAPDQASEVVARLTGGDGAAVVLDLVGSVPTTSLATQIVMRGGEINVIGVGQGSVEVGYGTIPTDVSVRFPYSGTRPGSARRPGAGPLGPDLGGRPDL